VPIENIEDIYSEQPPEIFAIGIKHIERLLSRIPSLGIRYGRMFYSDLLDKEMCGAKLQPHSSVLHIGCGPLPVTAQHLTERGHSVVAVDNDPEAVSLAEDFINRSSENADVRFEVGDGLSADASEYDAVWVSLHVTPRRRVLRNLLSSMNEGAKLIYRNPTKKLEKYYARVFPSELGEYKKVEVFDVALNKEVVVITVRSGEEDSQMNIRDSLKEDKMTLQDLEQDKVANIKSVPDDPLFSPLGLRPGKKVKVRCIHPFGGPVVVEVDSRRVALARDLAEKIAVVDSEVECEWPVHQAASASL